MAHTDPPTSEASPSPSRFRWRRLVQYRLRTLLILTAIIAALLAWWSHSARRQREAVAALSNVGADVFYTDEVYVLPSCLDVDYFASINEVMFPPRATDSDLERLQGLTTLRRLWIDQTQITDAGLEHLRGMTALKLICIGGTKITDAGSARLKQLLPNCSINRTMYHR